MSNIIRCVLPDGVHRYKPFTVADYRDFLLIRNDMTHHTPEMQETLIDELVEDYFGELPKQWQHYAFLNAFTGSIGKTKIPVVFECPECGKKKRSMFNISQEPLVNPTIKINENLKLNFNFPTKQENKLAELVLNNVESVEYENVEYKWNDLTSKSKSDIIDSIEFESFEELVKKLKPIHFVLKTKCCGKERQMIFDDLYSIFNLLISPDEVFPFYEINHILTKNNYSLESIMNMIPVERSIALSLVEKDNKQ